MSATTTTTVTPVAKATFWSALVARLAEPSTWAGISAGLIVLAQAMPAITGANGAARWTALGAATLSALMAVCKAEGWSAVAADVQVFEQVLPELEHPPVTTTVVSSHSTV